MYIYKKENKTNYGLLGTEIGAGLGLFLCLALKENIIPAFAMSLCLGYILGKVYEIKKA